MTGKKFKAMNVILSKILIAFGFIHLILIFLAHTFYSKGTGLVYEAVGEYERNLTRSGVFTPASYQDPILSFESDRRGFRIPLMILGFLPLKTWARGGGGKGGLEGGVIRY